MPREVKWIIALVAGVGLVALGWQFHWFLVTFHILLCFVLILVVLVQSGKAADLAGAFGGMGSQTAFGPRGAANFLTRATSWCAIMFMLTTISMVLTQRAGVPTGSSVLDNSPTKQEEQKPEPQNPAPAPPQTPPAEQNPPPAEQPKQ